MLIKRDSYALYHTTESEGFDIAIKDSCDRFVPVNIEELPQFIEDLVRISGITGRLSAKTKFEDL